MQKIREITLHKKICKKVRFDETMHCLPQRLKSVLGTLQLFVYIFSAVTKGSYYVALPDGRLQKVTYSVDAYGGYVADVSYEGTMH